MPRQLSIDSRVPTVSGVLIKRQAVEDQQRIYASLQQAQAYAKRIVREAQEHAAAIERQAMQAGYQNAWLESMNSICIALSDSDRLREEIRQSLKQEIRSALDEALQNPELELRLIDSWLSAGQRSAGELIVVLPQHAQNKLEQIRHRIEQVTGRAPTIYVGERSTLAIQSGDRVYEFCPDYTRQAMDELVHRSLQRIDVRRQCEEWSAQMVQHWFSEIDARFAQSDANSESSNAPDTQNHEYPAEDGDMDTEPVLQDVGDDGP